MAPNAAGLQCGRRFGGAERCCRSSLCHKHRGVGLGTMPSWRMACLLAHIATFSHSHIVTKPVCVCCLADTSSLQQCTGMQVGTCNHTCTLTWRWDTRAVRQTTEPSAIACRVTERASATSQLTMPAFSVPPFLRSSHSHPSAFSSQCLFPTYSDLSMGEMRAEHATQPHSRKCDEHRPLDTTARYSTKYHTRPCLTCSWTFSGITSSQHVCRMDSTPSMRATTSGPLCTSPCTHVKTRWIACGTVISTRQFLRPPTVQAAAKTGSCFCDSAHMAEGCCVKCGTMIQAQRKQSARSGSSQAGGSIRQGRHDG